MINKLLLFFKKYQEIITYIFFGGCTTAVNIVTFSLLRFILNLNVNIANLISVIVAILFAYFTNSKWVFNSKAKGKQSLKELAKFFLSRGFTMIIELAGLPILIKIGLLDFIAKTIIQVIVIILNYILSKIFVFKKNNYQNKSDKIS